MVRTLAVTLDLDGPHEYANLHALQLPIERPLVMYEKPLERFARLCDKLGHPGTLFVISRDARAEAASALRHLYEEGFEIASHSAAHDYRLSVADAVSIRRDLETSRDILEHEIGIKPVGFRAPGHHLSETMLDQLEALGFTYDSSVLPSPPYYAAKAAVLAGMRFLGKRSSSILGSPRMTLTPVEPYRPGRDPYVVGRRGIWELPIAVTRRLRLPSTGAALMLAPKVVRNHVIESLQHRECIIVNLHAIDLIDPQTDPLPSSLARHQPELRLSIRARVAVLNRSLRRLARGRLVTTCAKLADRFVD